MAPLQARLRGDSQNLHRAELTKLERDEQISRWVELIELKRVSAQVAPKPLGGRPESGVNAAARELDIERTDVQRAVKVAALSHEAKEAAREHGMDDNRTALLEAAAKPGGRSTHYQLEGFTSLTPAPPPFSGMNCTPAASKAHFIASMLAALGFRSPFS